MPSRFEEPPGIIHCPCLELSAQTRRAPPGHLECSRITANDLVFNSAGERGPEGVARVLNASRGQLVVAAVACRAAALLVLWSRSVFSLGAALANGRQLVQPLTDVPDLDFVKPLAAEVRHDVKT